MLMLFTLQRYEFFSKSQLNSTTGWAWARCCLPYKGTNFSANHNKTLLSSWHSQDVVYPTKVRIFQQITTSALFRGCVIRMLFTLQRYEFFSKSQPVSSVIARRCWCCLPYKGTNFSANHNDIGVFNNIASDVVYPTKVRIFQQITTHVTHKIASFVMLFTLQRYEFFSKSQLRWRGTWRCRWCCLPYKGTNFSANHNHS